MKDALSVVSDPDWREVMGDALRAQGIEPNWTPHFYPKSRAYADANAYAYADADADADANAYADANAAAYAYADANAYAYANADADADADANAYAYADANAAAYAYADANADANANANANAYANAYAIPKGEFVKNGLYLFSVPSGSVVVLRVAWLKRTRGDEYEAHGQRTPLRRDYSVTFDKAQDSPPDSWTWTEPIKKPCPVHRLQILGPVPLFESGYSKLFPKPKDFDE